MIFEIYKYKEYVTSMRKKKKNVLSDNNINDRI